MDQNKPVRGRPRLVVRILHTFLVVGCVLFAGVSAVVVIGGRTQPVGGASLPFALAAVAVGLLLVGALFIRRLVPRRNPEQSTDEYWMVAFVAAMMLWAVVEGAALLSIVGYLLTGAAAPAAAVVAAIAALFVYRPSRLEAPVLPRY